MSLSPDFLFSQKSLGDYLDCPRRFELRYILKQKWPAIQSEPVLEQELLMEEGRQFHQMVHRYVVGLPQDVISDDVTTPSLNRWWLNLMQNDPISSLPPRRYAEFSLSAPLAGFRLAAQYDLLAIEPGKRLVILDWKTSPKKPSRFLLNNHIQTRVYRYLLVTAGTFLNANQPIDPGQVEMMYWLTEFPAEPIHLPYSRKQFDDDRTYLESLIHEIDRLRPGQFFLTPDEKKCRFCNYRSLCNRGVRAADWDEQEVQEPAASSEDVNNLGFDQIGEIEF